MQRPRKDEVEGSQCWLVAGGGWPSGKGCAYATQPLNSSLKVRPFDARPMVQILQQGRRVDGPWYCEDVAPSGVLTIGGAEAVVGRKRGRHGAPAYGRLASRGTALLWLTGLGRDRRCMYSDDKR